MIEAAGGVVWRSTIAGAIEVLIIHRPRRADWSLPKGKQERNESAVECAVREVREETGLGCIVGERLGDVTYRDRKGRSKRVRYWAMEPASGEFAPNAEVDETRWVSVDEVAQVLTYTRDVTMVLALREALVDVA